MDAKISQKIIFVSLFLLFFFYLLQGIGNVPYAYWDESLYVPAADAYLNSTKPFPIPDHPPLGKEFIALGIKMFGYGPLGWRFFSVLCGALSCSLISYFSFRLTRRIGVALFIASLLFLEPLLVVHFRMALLDPPLTFFVILGTLWTFLFYQSDRFRWGLLIGIALCLGLAWATKFLALAFAPVWGGFILWRLWRKDKNFPKVLITGLIFLILTPLAFLSTYWVLGYTTTEAIELVEFIFAWHSTAKGPTPATSRWFEWLFIKNPIYYMKTLAGGKVARVVMVTGNFVLWIGAQLAALYAILRLWRRPEVWLLALLIALQFVIYFQKPSTYLHYMTEILPFFYLLLAVVIGDLFDRYGQRYRNLLLADLAVFYLGALIVFWNYWPKIWGQGNL